MLVSIQSSDMELAHSLLLNEEALKRIQESKRPVFVFEWLRFLDKVLAASQKVTFHFYIHIQYKNAFLKIKLFMNNYHSTLLV